MQHFRRVLELLVLEQAVYELGAGVLLLLGRRRRVGRKEHPRLDVDQRGRHENEFARHVDIHLLERAKIVEVLLGDFGNGNVVDVDLLLADQVEQEVERAFVDLDLHRRRWRGRVRGALWGRACRDGRPTDGRVGTRLSGFVEHSSDQLSAISRQQAALDPEFFARAKSPRMLKAER